MKAKTFIVLIIILIGLAAVTFLLVHKRGTGQKETAMGEQLFKGLDVNRITSLTVLGPYGKEVRLEKGARLWGVVQRYGYPADFGKIRHLVQKVTELKVGRSFPATPEVLARLKLISPLRKGADTKEKGTLVAFNDKDGNQLGAIIIGKQHGSSEEQTARGGQYVRLAGQDTVYLVDKSFPIIDTNPRSWLDKDLIRVKTENIRRISCFAEGGKVLYSLERQEKGKELQPMGTLRGKKLNKAKVNRLERAISFLSMTDVVDPNRDEKSLGIDENRYVAYELFDGIRYKIYPGVLKSNGKEEYYLKIAVDYVPTPKKTPANDSKHEKKENRAQKAEIEVSTKELEFKAMQLNERLSPWVFAVSRWNAQAFATDPQELMEKKNGRKSTTQRPRGNKKKG